MQTQTRLMLGFVALTLACFGQGNPVETGGHDKGVLHIYAEVPAPASLEDLVKGSQVIIEGEVQESLGTRLSDPARASSVYTDFPVTVKRVLKGPEDLKEIIVTQIGGKLGDLEVIPHVGGTHLEPGERDILFLNPDPRPADRRATATRCSRTAA